MTVFNWIFHSIASNFVTSFFSCVKKSLDGKETLKKKKGIEKIDENRLLSWSSREWHAGSMKNAFYVLQMHFPGFMRQKIKLFEKVNDKNPWNSLNLKKHLKIRSKIEKFSSSYKIRVFGNVYELDRNNIARYLILARKTRRCKLHDALKIDLNICGERSKNIHARKYRVCASISVILSHKVWFPQILHSPLNFGEWHNYKQKKKLRKTRYAISMSFSLSIEYWGWNNRRLKS